MQHRAKYISHFVINSTYKAEDTKILLQSRSFYSLCDASICHVVMQITKLSC